MLPKPKPQPSPHTMTISRDRRHFEITFESTAEPKTSGGGGPDHEEEKDVIEKFIQPCPYFQFTVSYGEEILKEIQREADKMKQRVTCFTNQYGARNEKTTAIFLNLLEVTREIGTNELKKKQFMNACYFYASCLGFVDPDDDVFLQKFITIKIDILNKLMFCLFEVKPWKSQSKYFDWSQTFTQEFLKKVHEYPFEQSLRKSDVCMVELNHFYLGRLYKKRKNYLKAIQSFGKSQEIISEKFQLKIYEKNPGLSLFAKNLEIKTFYKISKCLRFTEPESVKVYEGRALTEAQEANPALFQYINKKIRMYYSGREFTAMLTKMESKKRIEEEVLKLIEESSQKEFSSLYDVYKDNPNKVSLINEKCRLSIMNHGELLTAKLGNKRASNVKKG